MNRQKILVADPTIAAALPEIRSMVTAEAEWTVCASAGESAIVQQIADATVYIGGTWTPAMAQAAQALELIQVPGAGLDEINFAVLPPHVTLANVYNHERSIAEYVMMVVLALSRQLFRADARLRQGLWQSAPGEPGGSFRTLRGQVLGVVGFGHIGKQVARLANSFELRVRAMDQAADPLVAQQYGLVSLGGPADLPALLADCDFLVMAVPLTPATRHMLGAPQLAQLKPSAYLINVSRAELVQEEALYTALAEHRIAGAALDVWYRYPDGDEPTLPAHLPFHLLDNVILTPHYSGATGDTRQGRLADVASNLESWLTGKPLRNIVTPPEVRGS